MEKQLHLPDAHPGPGLPITPAKLLSNSYCSLSQGSVHSPPATQRFQDNLAAQKNFCLSSLVFC